MSGNRPEDENGESAVTGTGGLDGAGEPGGVGRRPPVADGGVPMRALLRALADRRRRFVLYYLRDGARAELDELATQLASWETGRSLDELDDGTRQDIRIELRHVHLPKLDEVGLIRYDDGQQTSSVRALPEPIERFLDYCATIDRPGTTE